MMIIIFWEMIIIVNMISFSVWKQRKKDEVQCVLHVKITARKLFPHGAHTALDTIGVFTANVTISTGISSKNKQLLS
jgi:hypothetical protein